MNKTLYQAFLIFYLSSFFLGACTTSVLKKGNPQFVDENSKNFAMVYVMRPTLQRTRGIADNDLTIEFGEKQVVVLLSAGEYAAFKIKPGALDIITRNITYLTGKPDPKTVWRARNFTFETGKTYFIEAKFTQEEFRGIYFIPMEIDLATAKSYAERMLAAGDIAKAHPINKL